MTKNERYFEINQNGHNIRCKLYVGNPAAVRRTVVFVHGFAGHKDNRSAAKFAERVLTKYKDTAVVTFDLPCHGQDVKKKLFLSDCIEYLDLVIGGMQKRFPGAILFAYGVSFGGYLLLKYIYDNGNPFQKIVLRAPALKMAELLTGTVMTADERQILAKEKPVAVGFDRKVPITPDFVGQLEQADICRLDYLDFADDLLIIHGTKDEVVPLSQARDFSEANVIECIEVDDADHRFQRPDDLEQATKAILDFFGF